MNHKLYILDKDYQFIDSLQKRMLLENNINVVGVQADASTAYNEMTIHKPDYLVFGYPMNFKAEQLVQAMKAVNPSIFFIAIVDKGMERFSEELYNAGIKEVFIKPVETEVVAAVIKKNIKDKENPYGTPNPFEQQKPYGNPFEVPVPKQSQNPFGNNFSQPVPTQLNNPFGNQPAPQSIPQPNSSPQQSPFGQSGAFVNQAPSFGQPTNYNQAPAQGGFGTSEPEFGSSQTFKTLRQNIVAIHCPKGGVGKTSISINTATALSTVMIGKQPLKVLLVDMDWEFGDVCVNMGLKPNTNVMKWINDIQARRSVNPDADMNFTGAQIDKYLIKYKTGLNILAAPPNHNDVVNIPSDAAKIIIENIKNNCSYDVIMFDCGNNTESYTLQALLSAHSIYEVITMDVSAMNDLSMLINTLKSIGFPMDKIKIIMNRVPKTKGDGDFSLEEISEALGGLPIAAKVPEYEKVRVQNNKGEPIVLSKNPNPFTDAIKMTANEIVGNKIFSLKKNSGRPTAGEGNSPKNNGEKKGFFSRLFG